MIKNSFNEEYKTPKCKVVTLCLGASCLQATSPFGETGRAGADVTVENDDYDY